MPVLFRSGSLTIMIWSNEGVPAEPVHIHIYYGDNVQQSDKFWLSKNGYFVPCKSNKHLNSRVTQKMIDSFINHGGVEYLKNEWVSRFGSIRFFDE